jgi:DNA-binding SARP family transcriptional activator/tetratricopeptide (TPR) repeat protein
LIEIRVLGPVEAWRDSNQVTLVRRQQRNLLGLLAIEAKKLVPIDRLIDLLWGDDAPRQARAILQSRVSELRAALHDPRDETLRLLSRGGGYVLEVPAEAIDMHRFRALVARARVAPSDPAARDLLYDALALWRGPLLGGGTADSVYAALRNSFENERMTATEELVDIELRLGNHRHIVDRVGQASDENPGRERLMGQSMLALYRSGRSADALNRYDRWRRWLADELGIDPGDEIQSLHLAILRSEPALMSHEAEPVPPEPAASAPALVPVPVPEGERTMPESVGPYTLPPDIGDFTGRAVEVDTLRQFLLAGSRTGCAIVAVAGPGGVGKTALAVHVAHLMSETFPDGQFYADLNGGQEAHPLEAIDVLGRFLRALGVSGTAMPETLAERIDLYRSVLAGRRVIVVLDNVVDDGQVVPLLPDPGSAVIINGRTRLGAAVGARMLNLDVLGGDEATQLLARIAGAARIAAEPEQAQRLCRQCGHLPLAIRVAAAKLASKPHWRVAKLVRLLTDEAQRLGHLTLGHLDVRATISLGYTGLSPTAQELLCRLAHLDSPEISVWLSAAVLDVDLDHAEDLLEELFDVQLLDVARRDNAGLARYRMHNLIRLFACTASQIPAEELRAGNRRAGAAWLFIADHANSAVRGGAYLQIRGNAQRWAFDEDVAERLVADTLRWFAAERPGIIAAVHRAADDHHHDVCWELVNQTSVLFETGRDFEGWPGLIERGLTLATEAGDVLGEAAMRFWTGCSLGNQTKYESAEDYLRASAPLFQRAGDRRGFAMATAYTGLMKRFQGHNDEALRLYEQALTELREVADPAGEAWVSRNLGQVYLQRGCAERADLHLRSALDIYRGIGSRQGEAQAIFWCAMLALHEGRPAEAEKELRQALELCQSMGDQAGEAQCLRGVGIAAQRRGDRELAMASFQSALQLVRQPTPTFMEEQIRHSMSELQ